jgi:tetratricopeptide (TPR) repeat protein
MRRPFALFFWIAASGIPALAQTYLVAPFSNRTKAPSFDWVGESLAESIRETLAEVGYATIVRDDREEAARKLTLTPVSQVSLASLTRLCEAAGADRLVYGRVELLPETAAAAGSSPPTPGRGTLRVAVRVLDVKDVVQIGEFFESGPVQELAMIATDLAWKVERWARPDRKIDLEEFRRLHPPVKNTARESYVRGLLAASPDERHRLLTQAVRLDPSFSQPAFLLGREHFLKANFREATGWLDRVPARNLNFIEARYLLALCRYHLSEFAAARQLLQEIAPQLQAPELWNNLAAAQARLSDAQALDNFKKALDADPADSDYLFNMGYSLWKRGEFDAAANYFRTVLDQARDDQDAIQLLGRCLKKSGPRAGDWRSEGLERLKESYEEPGPR